MIREFRPDDAEAVSAILHEEPQPQAITPAGLIYWLEAQPERARPRMFVADDDGRIVGWAESRLTWSTSKPGVADFWLYVAPGFRGRGIGKALFETVQRRLEEIGAVVLQTWTHNAAGRALVETAGFRATGQERMSRLELAEADVAILPALETETKLDGFRLVRLGEVIDDVEGLHRVYQAASADVPEYFTEDDIRVDEWRIETLEHPQLSRDGSFVVLRRDQPVALAFLVVDEIGNLAANEMTGTMPEYRGRGLARLAKLATIRWAKERGLEAILTGNAEANIGMLHLNESLGYRPVLTETHYVRD
jgi:GNAT superfamily N-acetyltransferase